MKTRNLINICSALGTFGACEFDRLGFWKHGTWGAWDFGGMGLSKHGDLEAYMGLWEPGTLGAWDFGSMVIFGPWDYETIVLGSDFNKNVGS